MLPLEWCCEWDIFTDDKWCCIIISKERHYRRGQIMCIYGANEGNVVESHPAVFSPSWWWWPQGLTPTRLLVVTTQRYGSYMSYSSLPSHCYIPFARKYMSTVWMCACGLPAWSSGSASKKSENSRIFRYRSVDSSHRIWSRVRLELLPFLTWGLTWKSV